MRVFLSFVSVITAGLSMALQTPAADQQKPEVKQKNIRADEFGDPLPEGAFYRLGTARMRHLANNLFFSAEGLQMFSWGSRDDLHNWDIATGSLVKKMPATAGCQEVVASPDSRWVAAVFDKKIHLADLASGKVSAEWKHNHAWRCLAFDKDGTTLVGLAKDNVIYRWDINNAKETAPVPLLNLPKEFSVEGGTTWVMTPDGGVLAGKHRTYQKTKNESYPWRFWDTATGKEARPPLMTSHPYWQSCWSLDGRLLAILPNSDDHKAMFDGGILAGGKLEVWDTVEGKRLPFEKGLEKDKGKNGNVIAHRVAFHPDGKVLATAAHDKVTLQDLNSGRELWSNASLPGFYVLSLAFSQDGKSLAVNSANAIAVLETTTGKPVGFTQQDPGIIRGADENWQSVIFAPDGRTFFVRKGNVLSLRATATGKEIRTFGGGHINTISPNGEQVSIATYPWTPPGLSIPLRVVEMKSGNELWSHAGQQGPWARSSEVIFSSDGKAVALLCENDGNLVLVDRTTGREIKKFQWQSLSINHNAVPIAVSADLKLAVAQSLPVEVWDLVKGQKLRELNDIFGAYNCRFLPNGWLAVPQKTGTELWDARAGKKLFQVPGWLAAYSPDGKWLLTTNLEVRSAQTGQFQAALPTLTRTSYNRAGSLLVEMSFSFDGSLLLAVDGDGHGVSLRETITGRVVWVRRDKSHLFTGATLSPDGRTLVANYDHHSLLVYDVTGLATEPGKLPALTLTNADAERLWVDLASNDGPRTHLAYWSLIAAGPQGIKALKDRLKPVKKLDFTEAGALVIDLDSNRFADRERAMQRLLQLECRSVLEKALANKPSLEVKMRIELLLPKLPEIPSDPDLLRTVRAISILEAIGGDEAQAILRDLAKGAPGARITLASKAVLERIMVK